ncbi:MAG: glycoside hydrolase family 9 protein [Alphaproteobacteria bacterium]
MVSAPKRTLQVTRGPGGAWSRRAVLAAPVALAGAVHGVRADDTGSAPRVYRNLTGYDGHGPIEIVVVSHDPVLDDPLIMAGPAGGPGDPLPQPRYRKYDPDTDRHVFRVTVPALDRPGPIDIVFRDRVLATLSLSDGLYQTPLAEALRSFYIQRCGQPLNDPANGLRHRPCHTDDRFLVADAEAGTVDPVGGWHHGDSYDKTVGVCAMVTALILGAYADHPAQFPDAQAGIPESGNGRSDALDEMVFGLNWLIGLQGTDGLLRGGIVGAPATRDRMPQDDTGRRRLLPPDLAATALAAGALLQAARVFEAAGGAEATSFGAHGRKALDAVERAVAKTPGALDQAAWSARIWALGEWALLTGERVAHRDFCLAWSGRGFTDPHAGEAAGFAALSALTAAGPDPFNILKSLEDAVTVWTADALARADQSPFGIVPARFAAQSNARVAMAGVILAHGAVRAGSGAGAKRQRAGALDHLHYLMGRNAIGKRFISGAGPNDIQALAHPMALAGRVILPGFVVAGPHAEPDDGATPQGRGAASHADRAQAYASNGASLTATAGLAALIARLDD